MLPTKSSIVSFKRIVLLTGSNNNKPGSQSISYEKIEIYSKDIMFGLLIEDDNEKVSLIQQNIYLLHE